MYRRIENVYKKESIYNILKKEIIKIYFICVISYVFVSIFYNKFYLIFAFLIIAIILMFFRIEDLLELKIYIRPSIFSRKVKDKTKLKIYILPGKNENKIKLNEIIKKQEIELFTYYLVKNKIYNEKSIKCIMEHYRGQKKIKIATGNLLAIISIAVPIILTFVEKDGFDFNGLSNAFPYIASWVIVVIILYYFCREIINVKDFITGEDGMNERLEEIFGELYVNCVNKIKIKNVQLKNESEN